jgi:hypothetical protein
MKEERRRPRERETHTHRAEPGRDIKWPFFFASSHSPVKFQTKAATSRTTGRDFLKSGVSCLRLLLPIYPS